MNGRVEYTFSDRIIMRQEYISKRSVSANNSIAFNFVNPHTDWTLLGAFVMCSGDQDATRCWGNVRTDQIVTIYGSIMSQVTQEVSGKVILIYLRP